MMDAVCSVLVDVMMDSYGLGCHRHVVTFSPVWGFHGFISYLPKSKSFWQGITA